MSTKEKDIASLYCYSSGRDTVINVEAIRQSTISTLKVLKSKPVDIPISLYPAGLIAQCKLILSLCKIIK